MILPFLAGRADDWFVARRKLDPTAGRASPWYFLRKGNLEEAQKAIDEQLPGNPDNSALQMQQAVLLALKGDFRDAESKVPEILAKIQRNDQSRHHRTYEAACIYALAGDSREAVKWLKETSASGFPNYPLFERDPYLDRIRTSREFVEFMADQKAEWEKYRQEFGT
jgi:tetratricopeptide (TPR) repeat protein